MKRYLTLITLFISALVTLVAEDRVFLFDESIRQSLKTNKRIVFVNERPGEPELLPQLPSFSRFLKSRQLNESSLSFESVYILDIKIPDNKEEKSEDFKKRILAATIDLESLIGLEYYSESSKKMKPLYTDTWFLTGKEKSFDLSTWPERFSASALVMQEDTSFGKNKYRYEWFADSTMCAFSSINETSLSYGIVKAAPIGGLLNVLAIFPMDDSLVLYAYTAIRTSAFLPGFMVNRIKKSLVNRIDALKIWFEERMNEKKAD